MKQYFISNNIPLYGCTMFSLSSHCLKDTWDCFRLSAVINSDAMDMPVQVFVCPPVSNSFGLSKTL